LRRRPRYSLSSEFLLPSFPACEPVARIPPSFSESN